MKTLFMKSRLTLVICLMGLMITGCGKKTNKVQTGTGGGSTTTTAPAVPVGPTIYTNNIPTYDSNIISRIQQAKVNYPCTNQNARIEHSFYVPVNGNSQQVPITELTTNY